MSTMEKSHKGEKRFSRRDLLKLVPPALLAGFWSSHTTADVQAASNRLGISLRGKDLEGRTVDLGNAAVWAPRRSTC